MDTFPAWPGKPKQWATYPGPSDHGLFPRNPCRGGRLHSISVPHACPQSLHAGTEEGTWQVARQGWPPHPPRPQGRGSVLEPGLVVPWASASVSPQPKASKEDLVQPGLEASSRNTEKRPPWGQDSPGDPAEKLCMGPWAAEVRK